MEKPIRKLPEEYEHLLVAVEDEPDCICNGSHEESDALWGGSMHPDDMGSDTPMVVRRLHSVELEYRKA